MVGFMSGFGSAFAQSFNQERQITAQKEQDRFRMDYADALSRKEKQDAIDKQNKLNIKAAKRITEMTGQPSEAWQSAYDLLSQGYDSDKVLKLFQENQASIGGNTTSANDTSGPADGSSDLTSSAASSVNAQMGASGMPTPDNGGIFGNLKGQTEQVVNHPVPSVDVPGISPPTEPGSIAGQTAGSTAGNVADNQQKEPVKPIASAVPDGTVSGNGDMKITWKPKNSYTRPDPSKISSLGEAIGYKIWAMNSGSKQDQIMADNFVQAFNDAKTKEIQATGIANGTLPVPSRGFVVDQEGNPTRQFVHRREDGNGNITWRDANNKPVDPNFVRTYDKNAETAIDKVGTQILKDTQDYNSGVTNLNEITRTASDLASIAQLHPESIGVSGSAAEWASKYYRGAKGLAQIITGQDLFESVEKGATPEQQVKIAQDSISKLDEAEKEVSNILQRTNDASYWAVLADVKATKLAYMYAATSGQTGRSVTQSEFENFKKAATANGNSNAIKSTAAGYVREQYNLLKDKEKLINDNSMGIRDFESQYGPFPYQPVGNIDELLKSDPENEKAVRAYLDMGTDASLNQIKQSQSTDVPSAFSPEEWSVLTEEEKQEYLNATSSK